MNKKFFYLLTLVAGLFSAGMVQSCKDYADEDEYNDLRLRLEQQGIVSNATYATKTELAAVKSELEAAIAACRTTCAENLAAAKAELQAAIDAYEAKNLSEHQAMQAQIQANTAAIEKAQGDIADLVAKWNALVAKDADLQAQIDANKAEIAAANAKIVQETAAREAAVAALQTQLDAVNSSIATLTAGLNNANVRIDSLASALQAAQFDVTTSKTVADQALALAQQDSVRIDAIDAKLFLMSDSLKVAYETANDAYARAVVNSLYILSLEKELKTVETVQTIVRDSLPILEQAIADSTAALRAETKALVDEAKAVAKGMLDDAIKGLNDSVSAQSASIASLRSAVQALQEQDALRNEQINNLNKRVTALEDRLDGIDSKLAAIQDQLASVKEKTEKALEALKALVTGITIQATDNPVFGSILTPMGIKSNVLISYHGVVTPETQANEAFLSAFPSILLSSSEVNAIGTLAADWDWASNHTGTAPYDYFTSEAQDNAGTIYFTINPGNVDFSGLEISIVNSRDEKARVVLSDVKKSDKKLTYGYTRADNGFYEAKARVTPEAASHTTDMRFDRYEFFRTKLKNVVTNPGTIDWTELATAIYRAMNDYLDATALCVTDANGRKVYSTYELAATTVQPLAFTFPPAEVNELFDLAAGKVESLVVKFANKATRVAVENILEKSGLDRLGDYSLQSLEWDEAAGKIVVVLNLPEGKTDLTDVDPSTIGIDITDPTRKQEMLDYIDYVKDYINILETGYTKLTSGSYGTVMQEFINVLLTKNTVYTHLKNLNYYLQPCLVTSTYLGDRSTVISKLIDKPSYVPASKTTILPTSYTGEAFAACFKKYVAVTAAYYQGVGENDLTETKRVNAAVADFNKVLDGPCTAEQVITTSELKAGYVYELTYLALDFWGNPVNEKFYIRAY